MKSAKPPTSIHATVAARYLSGECTLRLLMDCPPNDITIEKRMPGHNSAVWGSVYHNLLDEIWNGEHRDANLKLLFRDRVIEKIEADKARGIMQNEPNMRSTSSRRKIMRKAKGLQEAIENWRPSTDFPTNNARVRTRRFGREVWVEGSGTIVKGLIDEVTKSGERVFITDDKTGKIREEHPFQIRIYGLLWAGLEDVSEINLQLRQAGQVSFSEAQEAGDRKKLHQSILTMQKTLQRASSLPPEEIASPSHENCMWCPLRIVCKPHRKLSNSFEINSPGIYRGTLKNINPVGGGRIMITLEVEGRNMQTEAISEWCEVSSDDFGKEILLHAFYRNKNSEGILNPRNTSHYVSLA